MKRRALLAAMTAAAAVAPAVIAAAPAAASNVSYSSTSDEFPNPERGMFRQVENLPSSSLPDVRASDGLTLVRTIFRLDEFRGTDTISSSYLQRMDERFAEARSKGVKLIVRFAYNYSSSNADAPLARVLKHIDQLAPVINRNADALAYLEGGFIGAWAEWHGSENGLIGGSDNATAGYFGFAAPNAATKAISDRLVEKITSERKIGIRYVGTKRGMYGLDPVSAAEANTNTARARTGHINDCFLASHNDWGSYYTNTMAQTKAFLRQDALYTFNGGETCNDDANYTNCDNAQGQLRDLRFSTLNTGFHQGVLSRWQSSGCYANIKKMLGYRFSLTNASIPDVIASGGRLKMTLTVRNDGVAPAINRRPVDILLRNKANGAVTRVSTSADPRTWMPGTSDVGIDAQLPALANGSYDVLMQLPDASSSLRDNPEFAIRLANAGTWEGSTGFNSLNASLTVDGSAPSQPSEPTAPEPPATPPVPTLPSTPTAPTTPTTPTTPSTPTTPTTPTAPSSGNKLPSVKISTPAADAKVSSSTIAIAATATDPDGTVAKMRLYLDGRLVDTDTGAKLAHTASIAVGKHTLRVVATDNKGGESSSTITVTRSSAGAPVATFTTPKSGATTTSGTISVSGTATASKSLSKMKLYVDGRLEDTDPGAKLSDSVNLSVGEHTLKLVAIDSAGAEGSTSIKVTRTR